MAPPSNVASRLRERAQVLSARVIDEMYANPFWDDRFAARGRKHAEQDAQYHVTYLATAVEMGSATVMEHYAVWLRGVLTSRGMCTRHLDENFERLADSIAFDSEVSHHRELIEYLARARNALYYDDPVARELQTRGHELADRVYSTLANQESFELVPGINSVDDIRYLISFVADAIVERSAEHLASHLRWMDAFRQRVDCSEDVVDQVLIALDETFGMLSGNAGRHARQLLEDARAQSRE